jgi:hypothetical protein
MEGEDERKKRKGEMAEEPARQDALEERDDRDELSHWPTDDVKSSSRALQSINAAHRRR